MKTYLDEIFPKSRLCRRARPAQIGEKTAVKIIAGGVLSILRVAQLLNPHGAQTYSGQKTAIATFFKRLRVARACSSTSSIMPRPFCMARPLLTFVVLRTPTFYHPPISSTRCCNHPFSLVFFFPKARNGQWLIDITCSLYKCLPCNTPSEELQEPRILSTMWGMQTASDASMEKHINDKCSHIKPPLFVVLSMPYWFWTKSALDFIAGGVISYVLSYGSGKTHRATRIL